MDNKDNTIPETRELKVSRRPAGSHYVPGFAIQGKWLKNLGFNYNDIVILTHLADGTLNIARKGGRA